MAASTRRPAPARAEPASAGRGPRTPRSVSTASLAFALLAMAACGSVRLPAPDPDRPPDLGVVVAAPRPESPPDVARALAEARRLASLGRRGAAFARMEPVLRRLGTPAGDASRGDPVVPAGDAAVGRVESDGPQSAGGTPPAAGGVLCIEAERFVQDLLAGTRADAWIRRRTDERLRLAPADADANYLRGRIEPSASAAAARFEAALGANPAHPWARMGRAISFDRAGEPAGAVREAWHVAAAAPWLSLPWSWLGATAWSRGAPSAAERFLREAAARSPADPRPWTGLAAALDDLDRPDEAAAAAAEAVARAPGDPSVLWSVVRLLERSAPPANLRSTLRVADDARAECGDRAALDAFRGRLHLALGRPGDAEDAFESAIEAGAAAGDVAVPLRAARCESGRVSDAVAGWMAELPLDVTADGDLRAPAWTSLRAAADRGEDTPADADRLAAALDACGWAREAAAVVRRARARWPADPALRTREAGLTAFRAFLEELARRLRRMRRGARAGNVPSLGDVVTALRESSVACLGDDVTAGLRLESYPMLGSFASSTGSDGPFRDAFESRGLAIVVGARSGAAPDVILGRLVSHRPGVRASSMGVAIEYDEHVVETEGLPDGLAGQRGGLAGITLDRFVLIQLDVVRNAPAPEDAMLPYVPRPARDDGELRALDTPSDVSARIERTLARRGTLERDTFDAVVCHERVHVADAARMLPPWRHPLTSLAFAASHGFRAGRIEQTLEARAAVGAMIDAAEPRAALAALLAFLPAERGETAHVAGYRRAIEVLVDEVLRDADAFPRIDPRWNVVQQLDVLTSEECRDLGRRIARRLWPE